VEKFRSLKGQLVPAITCVDFCWDTYLRLTL